MTLTDKDLLINLALKHRSIISNKKTDAVSACQKEEGLRVLADEFRAESASIFHLGLGCTVWPLMAEI